MVSLARTSPFPRKRSNRRTFTCKNGSVIPDTSCSGLYPVVTKAFILRTSIGTACVYGSTLAHILRRETETNVSEFVEAVFILLTYFGNEGYGSEEHAMIAICKEVLGLCDEVIGELGNFFDDSQSAEGSLRAKYG